MVKVTKELFESLSKKDREQYRLKIDKIIDEEFHSMGITYIFWAIYYCAFILIVMPLWKLAFSLETFVLMSDALLNVTRLIPTIIAIGFCIDIIIFAFRFIRINRVKKEYFDLEVKVRRNK